MPVCWLNTLWKKQFPSNTLINGNLSIEYLKMKHEANDKLHYMPDFVGKRKKGHPKVATRKRVLLKWLWRS